MRTLSSALNTAYGLPVQKPAWLVEINTTVVQRRSSFSTVTWDSQNWTADDVNVSGLRVGALQVAGSLVLGNADDYWGGVALGEGFTDKRIRIWGYDASIAAPAASDPVLVCDAVGAGCDVSTDYVRVTLRDAAEHRHGPRATISPAFGFARYLPAGRTITINGVSYKLDRSR